MTSFNFDFSKAQEKNLRKFAHFFQVAIHFHPGHLQLKIPTYFLLIFTLRAALVCDNYKKNWTILGGFR